MLEHAGSCNIARSCHFREILISRSVVGNVGSPVVAGEVTGGTVDEADVAIFFVVGLLAGDVIANVEGQTAVRAVVFVHAGDEGIGQVGIGDITVSRLQAVVIGISALLDFVRGQFNAIQGTGRADIGLVVGIVALGHQQGCGRPIVVTSFTCHPLGVTAFVVILGAGEFFVEVAGVHLGSQTDLFQVAGAGDTAGFFTRGVQGGEQHSCQNCNNSNNDN